MAATPSPACRRRRRASRRSTCSSSPIRVPTTWAALAPARKNNTYLLPIATSYETSGSRTSSNRAIQWGEQIVKPIFESKDDNEVMYLLAKKLGFADQMFKNIKVENNVPVAEDILREINRGGWSTGYCGQSPERLKSHMANQKDFDMLTQKATTGPEQGRLLRSALAVLGHAGVQASRHAAALQHQPVDQGGRRHLPRPLRRGARGDAARRHQAQGQPARQRLLLQGLRDQGRLSRVHARRAEEARLGQGSDRSRTGGDQQGQPDHAGCGVLVDRPVGRHPARRDRARLHPLRQRQGPRQRVRPAGRHPDAPRADLHAAARSGREVSDAAECAAVPHAEYRLRRAEGGGREGHRQAVPARSSPPAVWSNTKAAAKRRAPTSGSPSCSRTCSSRSTLRTPPSAASRTAAGSGSPAPSSTRRRA